jgi:hypothetical protein
VGGRRTFLGIAGYYAYFGRKCAIIVENIFPNLAEFRAELWRTPQMRIYASLLTQADFLEAIHVLSKTLLCSGHPRLAKHYRG